MYHGSTKNDSENYLTELKIVGFRAISVSSLFKIVAQNVGPTCYHKISDSKTLWN